MSALGDAKVVLAEVPAITHSADRLKMALAALVAEIEAAPTVEIAPNGGRFVRGKWKPYGLIKGDPNSMALGAYVGKTVRLVGVE